MKRKSFLFLGLILPFFLAACSHGVGVVETEEEYSPPPTVIDTDTQEENSPPPVVVDDRQEENSSPPVVVDDAQEENSPPPVIVDDRQEEDEEKENVSVEEPPVEDNKKEEKVYYIKVKTDGLRIRSGAGTNFSSLGSAKSGEYFPLRGKTGNWYETVYSGKTAYLSANGDYTLLTSITSGGEETESVIRFAESRLGVKYVYGAVRLHDGKGKLNPYFTDSEFDCSSLVQYAFYYGAGVNLSLTTRSQIYEGSFVKAKDLSRGDCIYFTNSSRYYNKGIERVGHVGIYLGDGYILHTSSDYAKIEKISDTRWNYYIEARRFV